MGELTSAFEPLQFKQWVFDYTWQQIKICEILIWFFFAISVFWNITSSVIKSKATKPISIDRLLRNVFIGIALPFYIPLASFVFETLDLIREHTIIDSLYDIVKDAAAVAKTNSLKEAMDAKSEELGLWDYVVANFESLKVWGKGILMGIDTAPLEGLKMLIRGAVQLGTNVLIIVFYVLGPYALAFSVLPSFENKLEQWFKTYFTLCFVPITLNIIEGVYHMLFKDVLINSSILAGWGELKSMGIVFVILYTLPFWITGKIVGSSDAGRFLSQTAQIAALAMKPYLGKVLTKVPGIGGKLTLGNAIDTLKDAMSK